MKHNPPSPSRPKRRIRAAATVAAIAGGVLFMTACPGNLFHSYRSFESAVDRGASCSELFAQRSRFKVEATLAKVDADLRRIGCTSPEAARTDR